MNLSSDAWCDLVFEGRNQAYGAYYLRKTSSRRHILALSIVMGATVLLTLSLHLFYHFRQSADMDSLREIALADRQIMQGLYYELPPPPKKESPSQEKKSVFVPEVSDVETEDEQEEALENEPDIVGLENADNADSSAIAGWEDESETERIREREEDPITIEYADTDMPLDFRRLQSSIVRYVYQNVRYPEIAYKQKIEGRVVFSLIINTDGSTSDISLEEQNYVFFEQEALRVLRSMPAWEPARKDGAPVKVKFVIPVSFTL